MKKGFTLLELMIVIIIIGVLATLGIVQYMAAIEKSRGAEARQVLGNLRTQCGALFMQDTNTVACTAGNLNLGQNAGQIPSTACLATNFFRYTIQAAGAGNTITFRGTRCTALGKAPQASTAQTIDLAIDYAAGTDIFTNTGAGGY